MSPTGLDRRTRRHRETVDEVVEHALDVMSESGAAGLSLGEVARRMGIRTPSLYGYFPSKAALYDEVFARGWRAFGDRMQPYDAPLAPTETAHGRLAAAMRESLAWSAEHPAYSQLMFWRPVPVWEPSPAAYEPAVAIVERTRLAMYQLQQEGHLHPAQDAAEAADAWTVMVAGLISQRLSNEPTVPPARSRVAVLVDPLVSGFLRHYRTGGHGGPTPPPRNRSRPDRSQPDRSQPTRSAKLNARDKENRP
jgi:AcrR family transcriptional regulator